jgi:FlaG/FlaF family flagellin (archaellin)
VYSDSNDTIAVAVLIAAAIMIVMFFSSRKHVISIQSASTSILFHTKGMNQSVILDFVNKIEEARFNYSSL